MSTPAAISASSTAGSLLAGPTVAMILVCRTNTAYSEGERVVDDGDQRFGGERLRQEPIAARVAIGIARKARHEHHADIGTIFRASTARS